MPRCDLVITHGGHGTLARALASGGPVLVCPAGGDMAESAARVDWAGVGVRLAPRFCTPWGLRLAVRRALARPQLRERAHELAGRALENPGPATAATQLEHWAARMPRV
jgi:UDP:flavonoid glycosyltransferase YjiC (YdhE family)